MPLKPPFRLPPKPPVAPKTRFPTASHAKPSSGPSPASQSQSYSQSNSHASPHRPSFAAWTFNVVVGVSILVWLRDHYVKLDRVRGSSMAPTLSPDAHETGRGDWVVLLPFMERAKAVSTNNSEDTVGSGKSLSRSEKFARDYGVKRGDVVTFWKPHKPEEMGIKRVVAIEGDIVYPARGYALDPSLRVNRAPGMVDGLPDPDPDSIADEGNTLGKVVVPHGHVWVEGDNWRKSYDSNDFGPISKGLLEGRARWIWRDWWGFRAVGDGRKKTEEKFRSRVVHGRSEIPVVFVE